MTRTATRRLLTAIAAAMLLAAVAAPADARDALELHAQAGLGGIGRPGRLTPVRITLDNRGADISGDLVVEWGDARVHRAIDLPAPSSAVVELYIRTTDVREAMSVRLLSGGETLAVVSAPIGTLSIDVPFVVCAGVEVPSAAASECTVALAATALPRSMRGWDAADDVRLGAGAESRLAPEQRSALRRWRAYHELETHDLLQRAPRASWSGIAPDDPSAPTMLAVAIALASFTGAAWIWVRARGSALRSYGTFAMAIVISVVAGVVVGRAGPASVVVVQHTTALQQVGDAAVISLRARIEYPAFDTYTMRVTGVDGSLTHRFSAGREEWLDAAGAPVRRGVYGRGAREEVELDAVADVAPFQVMDDGDIVRITNVSKAMLRDCQFPEGFTPRYAGALAPNAWVEARAQARGDAPFFSCTMADAPVTFDEARFPVRLEGSSIVSVRVPGRLTEGPQ